MQEPKRSLSFMMILSAFMAFASLSTDIYLPAMPAMQDDLGGAVALTITSFLVGFAIAQLVWGPISDHIGRRMPLAIGALLFFSVHFLPETLPHEKRSAESLGAALLPRVPMRRRSPKFRMRSRVLRRHSSAHSNTAVA